MVMRIVMRIVMGIVMRFLLVTMMMVVVKLLLLTSNKASDAALAVSVKLDAAGESCSDSSATVTDLSVCVLTQLSKKKEKRGCCSHVQGYLGVDCLSD